jgi:hypothetical protein
MPIVSSSRSSTPIGTTMNASHIRYGRIMCALALLLILHASYSMIQFRDFVKATNSLHVSIPLDIVLECIIGLLLCTYGSMYIMKPLKPIKASVSYQERSWDSLWPTASEYISLKHRSRLITEIKQQLNIQ